MADGQATDTAPGETLAGRRSWRLPADEVPERPDYTVVRRLVLGSALMLFLELALIDPHPVEAGSASVRSDSRQREIGPGG